MGYTIAARRATPYGPLGLAVSLVCGLVLAAVYFGVVVGLVALGDAALFGWGHPLSLLQALRGGVDHSDGILVAYAFGLVLYLAIVAAVLTLARFRGGADWRRLVAWWPERPWWRDRIYWLWVAAGIVYGIVAGAILSRFYPPSAHWLTLPSGTLAMTLLFLLAVVMAPCAEEIVFRGWIYTSLRSRYGTLTSVTVSALLFAFAHYESTHLYALAVFPVGLILGAMRERTGTIWATVGLHALFNFSAWLLAALGTG